jgi:hypothetical protein
VSHPAPALLVTVAFEGRPELRLAAFSAEDFERLRLWLTATPVLVDLAEAVLVLLADLLREEGAE